jgi:hypothetical protein
MWPAIAMAIGGAVMGAVSNSEKQKARDAQQKFEAEKTRGAPFTGQWGQYLEQPSLSADIIKGAGAGMSMYSQNAGMFGGKKTPETPAGTPEARTPERSDAGYFPQQDPGNYDNWDNRSDPLYQSWEEPRQAGYYPAGSNQQSPLYQSWEEPKPAGYYPQESLSQRIARMKGI